MLQKVSPWKGVIQFRKWGKLGPIYVQPFWISARVGKVAYQMDFLIEIIQIHNTFHLSQLWKCMADKSAVVPLDDIHVDERLNYFERPVAILRLEDERST